jgi:hypothetical protein
VSVPERSDVVLFAVTLTSTTPVPEPLAPLAMVIQPRSELAVQVHWVGAVTFTELDPPDAANVKDVVDSA